MKDEVNLRRVKKVERDLFGKIIVPLYPKYIGGWAKEQSTDYQIRNGVYVHRFGMVSMANNQLIRYNLVRLYGSTKKQTEEEVAIRFKEEARFAIDYTWEDV